MKHILHLILLLFTAVSCTAADPATFRYEGEVAGVMCSACSSHVETALKTIPGVKSITIVLPKDGLVPKLEITATSAKITREDCIKALGDAASRYEVRSLKLAGSK